MSAAAVRRLVVCVGLFAVVRAPLGCSSQKAAVETVAAATHSGPMALSSDGSRLYVVHPDADAFSIVDTTGGAPALDVLLASSAPGADSTGRYTPSIAPRALALDPLGKTLFVSGERSGHVYAFDAESGTKLTDAMVCAEPVGVVVSSDGHSVFVACSQDDIVVELEASTLNRVASAACPHKPWSLAWAADGTTLLATHLLGWAPGSASGASPPTSSSPGISAFQTAPLSFASSWIVADGPPGSDPTVPHGQVRGIYDAMVRPGTSELWVVHMMLGTDTGQPDLNFQNTVFPAVTILNASGQEISRLTVSTSPGDGAAFGDIVSGPRALTFSPDGNYAFIVDADSEDVLIVDARQRIEAALVRPLPGHLPEGAVWGPSGKLYVQERNTQDVAVIDVTESPYNVTATVESSVIRTLASDPMPSGLRLGQHLFFSSNSDEYPLTANHWVSCASCHLEGRSDAVTWKFAQGPRDTPSNAGGMLDTGFLFRTADRNKVEDYWKTIDVEQGGDFSAQAPSQAPLLEALANYVNYAIPVPVPPTQDPQTVAAGKAVFQASGCPTCHHGPALTDSGDGNPSLNLSGALVSEMTPGGVLLHDVGTCVTTAPWPDVSHDSIDGQARPACDFDTPALRGLWDAAPYLHDGSALTLDDAVQRILHGIGGDNGVPFTLSSSDEAALLAYLKSL